VLTYFLRTVALSNVIKWKEFSERASHFRTWSQENNRPSQIVVVLATCNSECLQQCLFVEVHETIMSKNENVFS